MTFAACTPRDRASVRTCFRVTQEGADAVRRFRRQDMLELAGLLLDYRLVRYPQSLHEQDFRQPVTSDDVFCALAAAIRELNGLQSMLGRGM